MYVLDGVLIGVHVKTLFNAQGVPRTVALDQKTGSSLLQWPVKEVNSLRLTSREFDNVELKPGSVVPLEVGPAAQVNYMFFMF